MSITLELAVQDVAGVRIARRIGAARVELTQALALGGLTPSAATIDAAVEASGIDGPEVHVLIRPRAGGFRYSADEAAVMEADVRHAVARGASGVVIGGQDGSGALDEALLRRLQAAAAGASVTLHRVIDVVPDPVRAMHLARELGLRRVLTSGGASTAVDGRGLLRALVAEAAGGIEVMAGSGVTAANAPLLVTTGVDALHFSAKRTVTDSGRVRMGSASDGVGGYETTDEAEAFALRDAVAGA